MDIFCDLEKLLKEEIKICDKNIKRKRYKKLYTKIKVHKIVHRENDILCMSEVIDPTRTLDYLGIVEGDSLVFKKEEYIPTVKEFINNPKLGLINILSWSRSSSFYSIFQKGAPINQEEYFCICMDDIISMFIQYKVVEMVKNSENENSSWIKKVLLKEYNKDFEEQIVKLKNTKLDESKKAAVNKAIWVMENNNSFMIIQGPPGTGKTTVIAEIIAQALERNKKVLITSHTNVAVDNAMEKIIETYPELIKKLVRLGHVGKVSDPVKEVLYKSNEDEDIENITKRKKVVGTTISKLANLIYFETFKLDDPIFDLVIVDESSMATIPLTLIPLFLARSFILVGDHHQLPPITPPEIPESVSISLFEYLIKNYPIYSCFLNTQYRSNEAIIRFSNKYIYNGKLNTHNSNKDIKLNKFDCKKEFTEIFDPDNIIVWLKCPDNGEWIKNVSHNTYSAINACEAALSLKIYKELAKHIKKEEISIIAYYKLHSILLKRRNHKCDSLEPDSLMNYDSKTIDSYQGREAEVVILNFVKGPGQKDKPPKALENYQRLNVALTRAKKKLIIIAPYGLEDINIDWENSANPRNLYNVVKKLEAEGKGKIISIEKDALKEELNLVEKELSELKREIDGKQTDSEGFTKEDMKLLSEIQKYRKITYRSYNSKY